MALITEPIRDNRWIHLSGLHQKSVPNISCFKCCCLSFLVPGVRHELYTLIHTGNGAVRTYLL